MSLLQLDFSALVRALPFLLHGLLFSLLLTVVAMAGGVLIGLFLAVLRLSPSRIARLFSRAYVNGFRAMPLILVLFWFYFLMPLVLGRPIDALPAALIAFTFFEAAYYAEIIRAGLQSAGRGQWEAAFALGLGYFRTLRLVIVPQAFRRMLPLGITQAVILFQDTALVYVISLRDFMTSVSIVANRENRVVEFYVFAALVYFIICTAGASLARRARPSA